MASILPLSLQPVLDDNGDPVPAAELFFYLNETTTAATAYTDADETVPASQPTVTNLDGRFPDPIYLDGDTTYTLKIVDPSTGLTVMEVDDYKVTDASVDSGTQSYINLAEGRTTINATTAAAFDNGSVVTMAGLMYQVDTTKIGTDSVTFDLGVDGLVPYGHATPEHYGYSNSLGTSDRNAAMQRAFDGQANDNLVFNLGPYDISALPTGLDDVHCVGSPRTVFSNVAIPLFNGVFTGNSEIAVIAFVLRYYEAGQALDELGRDTAGYYLIADKSGANHETVLAGPVTASGTSSLVMNVRLSDWGLDDTLWTPAGCVLGPDDGFAREGIHFGGSVGTDDMQITGAYGTARTGYAAYNGSTWSLSGLNGSITFSSGVVTYTRDAGKTRSGVISSNAVSFAPTFTPRAQASGDDVDIKLNSVDETGFSFRFLQESDGARMNSESTRMETWITDPAHTNLNYNFSAVPTGNTNIWGIFIARRKPGSY